MKVQKVNTASQEKAQQPPTKKLKTSNAGSSTDNTPEKAAPGRNTRITRQTYNGVSKDLREELLESDAEVEAPVVNCDDMDYDEEL